MLVLKPDTARHTHRDPHEQRSRPHRSERAQDDHRPQELINRRRPEKQRGAYEHATPRDRTGSERLGPTGAAQLVSRQTPQQDRRNLQRDGDDPQRQHTARQCRREPGKHRRERRLVGVPPGQVPAARNVIELVAMPPVTGRDHSVANSDNGGDRDHWAPRDRPWRSNVVSPHHRILPRAPTPADSETTSFGKPCAATGLACDISTLVVDGTKQEELV